MDNDFAQNQMEILKDIKSSYSEARLIPFIGAGFSKNIRDYPGWKKFIAELEKDIDVKEGFFQKNFGENFLQATEYYILKKSENPKVQKSLKEGEDAFEKGKRILKTFIQNKFNKKCDSDWKVHNKLINAINFHTIFTTNWDDSLEKACDFNKICYEKILIDRNFRDFIIHPRDKRDNGIKQIIKFHGDCDRTDSIIACETDYYKRMVQLNSLDIKLKHDLLYYDFLFLGYNFGDININYVFYQMDTIMNQISSSFKPNIFFVSLNISTNAKLELFQKRKGMRVFYLPFIDKIEDVEKFDQEYIEKLFLTFEDVEKFDQEYIEKLFLTFFDNITQGDS